MSVSRIILGCGNFGGIGSAPEFFGQGESEREAHALLEAAWDLGITTFDTADAYGGGRSESYIGSWLGTKDSAVRDRVVVTTKLYHSVEGDPTDSGLAPTRIRRCVEASLARLGLERLPLYMAHQPDPATPIDATLAEFDRLIEDGTVGAVGACNIDANELAASIEASQSLRVPGYGWVQNSYNLLDRADDAGVTLVCDREGLGYTPFGPLAGGWLTGKYGPGGRYPAGSRMTLRPEPYRVLEAAETYAALSKFGELAQELGVDRPTLAYAWLFAQPAVTAVIVGPRRVAHLEPAVRGLDLRLSMSALERLDAIFVDGGCVALTVGTIELARIERAAAAIRGHVVRTPLLPIEIPNRSAPIYLKLENLQPIGSFKLRGALSALDSLADPVLERGVVAASAGNMAQGVAWAARLRGYLVRGRDARRGAESQAQRRRATWRPGRGGVIRPLVARHRGGFLR